MHLFDSRVGCHPCGHLLEVLKTQFSSLHELVLAGRIPLVCVLLDVLLDHVNALGGLVMIALICQGGSESFYSRKASLHTGQSLQVGKRDGHSQLQSQQASNRCQNHLHG